MKKYLFVFAAAIALVAACGLTACSGSSDASSDSSEESIPSLVGSWQQTNSSSDASYMIGTITDDAVTIYWYSVDDDGTETTALYWAGTYEAPDSDEAYSWTSEADHDQTDTALLASSSDTKEFSYDNGVLSFEVTALGTTTTVTMEKVADDVEGDDTEDDAEVDSEDPQPIEIVESGYYVTDSGYIEYGICWTNPNETYAIEYPTLYIVGYAEDGSIVFSDSHVSSSICPGETQYFASQAGNGTEVARVEFSVESSPSYVDASEVEQASFTISNTSFVEGSYGRSSFTGQITTVENSGDISRAKVSVILRDENGNIVYGDFAFVDVGAEGETAAFEISAYSLPDFASYEIYAIPWT